MDLDEKLRNFREGLNQGKIDWEFICGVNASEIEKNAAIEILVERGFINLIDMKGVPKSKSNNWVVKNSGGRIVNPCFGDKRAYFLGEKYAKTYVKHLKKSGQKGSFRAEDYFGTWPWSQGC